MGKNDVFDPKTKAIELDDGRLYLPVASRVEWFRNERPEGIVNTEIVNLEKILDGNANYCIAKAEVFLDKTDERPAATNFAMKYFSQMNEITEKFIENAITAAIGRALALAGFNRGFIDEDEDAFCDAPAGTPKTEVTDPERQVDPEKVKESINKADNTKTGLNLPPATGEASTVSELIMPEEANEQFEIPEAFREAQAAMLDSNREIKSDPEANNDELDINKATATVFPFGKYRNKTIGEIAIEDAEYLDWFVNRFDGKEDLKAVVKFVLDEARKGA